jgi:5'-nucleotidase
LLILLTNDDGIHSKGITTLRDSLMKTHDVRIVAPERERTCVGHAITLHKPLRIREIDQGVYSTNGSPADCVYLGIQVILNKKPDLIISGINTGPNMGRDVNYSGTVAAAKEGAFLGVPSIAVSICSRQGFRFQDAARTIHNIIDIIGDKPFLKDTFLNVNIPNIPFEQSKGFMVTRLGKRIYNEKVLERTDPRGGKYYWIGGNAEQYEDIRGTDFYAIEKGYVSITPLSLNMTDTGSMKSYRAYFRNGL